MVYRSEGPKGLVTTNSSFGYPVSITLMRVCRVIFLIIFTSDSTQCNLLSRRYQFFLRKGKKAPPIESRKNIKNAHHTLFVVVVAGGGVNVYNLSVKMVANPHQGLPKGFFFFFGGGISLLALMRLILIGSLKLEIT